MKRLAKHSLIIVFVIVFLLGNTVVNFVYEPFARVEYNRDRPIGPSDFSSVGIVRIDTETILASLKRGDTDIFASEETSNLEDMTYTGPELYPGSIPWSQSDYLVVVSALNDFIWNDDIGEWSLFHMEFQTTCEENVTGFRSVRLYFFKSKFDQGKLRYSWRMFYVTPAFKNVLLGEGDYPHPIFGWKQIKLDQLKVSADVALGIAEERGGKDTRLDLDNQCGISVRLMPQNWDGWRVSVGGDFDMSIPIQSN